jgi:hypothetical protein
MNQGNYRALSIIVSVVIISAVIVTVFLLSRQTSLPETTPPPDNSGSVAFPTSGNVTPLNPDMQPVDTTAPEGDNTSLQAPNPNELTTTGSLKNITDVAIGGAVFIEKDRNGVKTEFLRYIEKGTGHIKEISFDENIPTKVTNTTITAIYDSLWSKDGNTLIIRRLDGIDNNIQTVYGRIVSENEGQPLVLGEIGKLKTTILPTTVLDIVTSPLQDKLFALIKNGENVEGFISDFGGENPLDKKLKIWESPLSEWQITWPKNDQLMLLTKPAYNVNGYLFSLSVPKEHSFNKLIGEIIGLTSLVHSGGKKIIYSETTGLGFLTYYLDRQSGELKVLPIKTLPEKCVWSKLSESVIYCGVPKNIIASKYPDDWYKGIISFSDDIYRIDLDVNKATRIRLQGLPGNTDATNPVLSPSEDYLSFINKYDGTSWMVKIK